MKVELAAPSGGYTVEQADGDLMIVAADKDDERLAAIAQQHAVKMVRLHYSPGLGEPFALFVAFASRVLGAKVVGSIPAGAGELEQAFADGEPDRRNCGTGDGGFGEGNTCAKGGGGGGEAKKEASAEGKGPKVPRSAEDIPSVEFSATADSDAFVRARNSGAKRPENFSELDRDRLDKSTKILSSDGTAGCLVDENGDLGNVFNNGSTKGAGSAAVLSAIETGGAKTLDCYDGFLPALYTQLGFEAVAKIKWNDEYAPPGWDYSKNGRPDVVIMKYKGGSRKTIRQRVGTFKPYVPLPDDRYTDDFDAAKRDAGLQSDA